MTGRKTLHLTPSVSCLGQFLGGHIHEYKSFDPHAGPVCVIRCGVRGVLAADHSDPASADHARDVRRADGRGLSRETLWASRSSDLPHSGGSRCAGLFDDYRTEISNVSMYDVQQYYRYSKRWYFDIEDILVKSGVPDAALADFREALSSCVVYKAATPRFLSIDIVSFSGLSMFLPNADSTAALWDFYRGLSWNQATGLIE